MAVQPTITPHSKNELQMRSADDLDSDAWTDVRVWLHHDADGTATLITCFERQAESGYEYVVVSPQTVRLLSLNDFQRDITGRRQQVHVKPSWKKHIWAAYQENPTSVRDVMRRIQAADVAEVCR